MQILKKHKMNYEITDELRRCCPDYVAAIVEADVVNSATPEALWLEIEKETATLRQSLTPDTLKTLGPVSATRDAYRRCGKDPSRYRPSGEQLVRRILQGKELYRIDTLVDLINLASLASGYSIGGFDADTFTGDTLRLGIGREDEPYYGIGRGGLNIAGMPVWRDDTGGVGTPTSDNERTKLTLHTRRLTAIVNGYDGSADGIQATAERIRELLRRYAQSDGGTLHLVR